MYPITTIYLRQGGRIAIGPNWTKIFLPNGSVVEGCPQGTPEQLATSQDLGYSGDVVEMVRNHDPLHALMCDLLGMEYSYSMFEATGLIPPEEKYMTPIEEAAIINLQRFICHLGLDVIKVAKRNGYTISERVL